MRAISHLLKVQFGKKIPKECKYNLNNEKKIKNTEDANQINHKLLSFNPVQFLSLLHHFTRTLANKFIHIILDANSLAHNDIHVTER